MRRHRFAAPVVSLVALATVCLAPRPAWGTTLVWKQYARGQMFDCNGAAAGGEYQWPDNTLWSQAEVRGTDPCGEPNVVLEPSNWNAPYYPDNSATLGNFDVILGDPANTTLDVNATIDTLTVQNDGHLDMLGGTALYVSNSSLVNDNQIVVNSDGGGNAVLSLFSPTNSGLVSGSGEIVLNQGWTAGSYGATFHAGGSLTTQAAGHTIRGKGYIEAHLTNNGMIVAEETSGGGDPLLQLAVADQTNNNIIQANLGATLRLQEITLTQNPNTGRLIGQGDDDSDNMPPPLGNVELGHDTRVVGGTLEGDIDITDGTVTLDNVVNLSDKLDSVPGTTTHLAGGTFTNNGVFGVTSPFFNQFTYLHIDDNMLLTGGGELALGQFNAVRVSGESGVAVTNDTGHTISGEGKWYVPLVNNGLVEGHSISFEGITIQNNSTMTTQPGGGISILNTTVTQNSSTGMLLAGHDGAINLTASTVIDGELEDTPSATAFSGFRASNAHLVNVHNKARINVLYGTTLRVEGSVFTNDGPITVNNDHLSLGTRLRFDDSVSLEGTGEIRLNQTGLAAQLLVIGGGVLTQAATHTIYGAGQLDATTLINHGTITDLGIINAEVENDGQMTNIGEINGSTSNAGTLGGSLGRTLQMNAPLTGDGPLQYIQVNDRHQPGAGVATVTVQGEYRVGANGTLAIDIGGTTAGTEYDQIDLPEVNLSDPVLVYLDGTLAADLVDLGGGTFVPSVGDTFTVVKTAPNTMDTIAGTFAQYDLPRAAGGKGLVWDVLYGSYDVTLKLVATLTGDYNGDGVVNLADYTVWRDTLGSTTDLTADGDQSGTIDIGDYTVWKNQFGMTAPSPLQQATVPEPGTCALLLTGMALCMMLGRRGGR